MPRTGSSRTHSERRQRGLAANARLLAEQPLVARAVQRKALTTLAAAAIPFKSNEQADYMLVAEPAR